eukprot:4151744-Pyramimonas_sp.AAC.1
MNVPIFENYREALSFDSEHSHAWKELYEVPGGDKVDGSPPAPVSATCNCRHFWDLESSI